MDGPEHVMFPSMPTLFSSHAISKWKTFLSGSGALSYNSSVALEKHKQQLLQKQEHTLFSFWSKPERKYGSNPFFKSSFQLVSETPHTDEWILLTYYIKLFV